MIGRRWDDAYPAQQRMRWLRRLGMAMVIGSLMAAAGQAGYSVAKWRGNSAHARSVAADRDAPAEDRVEAMIGAHRDAAATIDTLKEVSREPGRVGQAASTLLRYLSERSR